MEDTVLLTFDKLSVEQASADVGSPGSGAISMFVGTTRDNFEEKAVTLLEYEAYEPMAIKEMKALCVRARERWPAIIAIGVYHRLGTVPIGEASVIISVSSPHRADAIEACHFVIDDLKARVPIWKKEVYHDGSTWKENKEFKKTIS